MVSNLICYMIANMACGMLKFQIYMIAYTGNLICYMIANMASGMLKFQIYMITYTGNLIYYNCMPAWYVVCTNIITT